MGRDSEPHISGVEDDTKRLIEISMITLVYQSGVDRLPTPFI